MNHAHERALAGAAILDLDVARLLLSELDEDGFEDPTARLVLRVLREGLHAEEQFYGCGVLEEDLPEPPPGWVELTDLEMVLEVLDCSGRLDEAGGAEAVAGLVEDRLELRAALAAGRAALASMTGLEEEPIVELAGELLG
jgi:hypothetical protein